jgi:O-antigen/teichoic acid export membrane protein
LLYVLIGVWLAAKEIGLGWRGIDREDYRSAWREFLPFSLHTSVTQSIKALAVNADTLILGLVRPANEVAYYRIARSAASLITMPTAPVSSVLYPEMVEAWAHDQVARIKQLVRRYALVTLGIGVALVAFYVVTARWLVEVFYGAEYYDAAPLIGRLIVIIGIGVALESTFRWVRPATLARGLPQLTTVYSLAAIALRIVLLIPLTAALGALGGALTYDIVVVFTIGMIAFYVLPRLGLWAPPGQETAA